MKNNQFLAKLSKKGNKYRSVLSSKRTVDEEMYRVQFLEAKTSDLWDEVSHNIVDLNAKAMQEIVNLIPEDDIFHGAQENITQIETLIQENLNQTAKTLFRTKRYLLGMKAEFSVVEKLVKQRALNKLPINMRNVVIGVVHLFSEIFMEKNITLKIEEWYVKSLLDYETIQVALYYLIGNASKYIKENTTLNISFKSTTSTTSAILKMTSLYITPEDEKHIFYKERYSGEMAKLSKLHGKGIGMYRAKKLIELNNGVININPGEPINNDNILYAVNSFEIQLPIAN